MNLQWYNENLIACDLITMMACCILFSSSSAVREMENPSAVSFNIGNEFKLLGGRNLTWII